MSPDELLLVPGLVRPGCAEEGLELGILRDSGFDPADVGGSEVRLLGEGLAGVGAQVPSLVEEEQVGEELAVSASK